MLLYLTFYPCDGCITILSALIDVFVRVLCKPCLQESNIRLSAKVESLEEKLVLLLLCIVSTKSELETLCCRIAILKWNAIKLCFSRSWLNSESHCQISPENVFKRPRYGSSFSALVMLAIVLDVAGCFWALFYINGVFFLHL